MIKVNLNKTKGSTIYGPQDTGLAPSGSTIFTQIKEALDEQKFVFGPSFFIKMAINIVFIACFPIGLKIYEMKEIGKLEKEEQQMKSLLTSAQGKLSTLKTELESYSYLKEKSDEFSRKKNFLKKLAETRLTVPRIVDLIQNKIPKTVWLENLKLKVFDEGHQLHISGGGFTEAHVNLFAGSLYDILDKNSITVNMQDIKEGDDVIKVSFELKGTM